MPRLSRSALVRWLPVLLWMSAIFYFSSRPQPLNFIPSNRPTGSGVPTQSNNPPGKLIHLAEYAGLTLLLHRALAPETNPAGSNNPSSNRFLRNEPIRLFGSILIAFAYAFSDEFHQRFVPGRGFELIDLAFDLTGMLFAAFILGIKSQLV
jgi:VanZ family protein